MIHCVIIFFISGGSKATVTITGQLKAERLYNATLPSTGCVAEGNLFPYALSLFNYYYYWWWLLL